MESSADLAQALIRLDRLEAENRRLKRFGRAIIACVAILAVGLGAAFNVDEALILRDRDGKTRFVAAVHPQEIRNTYISMADDRARQFVRLGNDPENGSYLMFLDSGDRIRFQITVHPDDEVFMRFFDRQGRVTRQFP